MENVVLVADFLSLSPEAYNTNEKAHHFHRVTHIFEV